MKVETQGYLPRVLNFMVGQYSDPFEGLLAPTVGSGTCLISYGMGGPLERTPLSSYVAISVEAILEYERKIFELRRELSHYKQLLAEVLPRSEQGEEYPALEPVIPLDASSVTVVNSILSARVPASASFNDFTDEEI